MKNLLLRAVVGIGVCAAVIGAALADPGGTTWWLALRLAIAGVCLWELWHMRVRGKWWAAAFVAFSTMVPLFYIIKEWGAWAMLWYVFIIWANDVGAYLVGSAVGRHKLAPLISPKKTWEGAVGGLAAGVAVGVWSVEFGVWSFWFGVGLAVVAVVAGVIGDLAESWLKRRAGVKDSGRIFPGHGGMLDRFDSLIFSAPFVWIYFVIFA